VSGDRPPVGPNPPDDVPAGAAEHGELGAPAGHPASGLPSLTPPGPPSQPGEVPAPAPAPLPADAGNPDAAPAPEARTGQPPLQWILVVVGIPIGFVAWVVGSLLLLGLTGASPVGGTSGSNVLTLVLLVVLLAASVGLIVWRRTRRLAQGFVLGAAIGLVVAGGLCIPLVSSF
jgi:hypothetical protein